MTASIEDARRAKAAVGQAARTAAHVVGVGLTRVGDSYAVKVNLAEDPVAGTALPATIDGVPIVYQVVGRSYKLAAR